MHSSEEASASAILQRVRLVASRDAPAWGDPDPDPWPTDFDSLTELSDDETAATTTMSSPSRPTPFLPSFLFHSSARPGPSLSPPRGTLVLSWVGSQPDSPLLFSMELMTTAASSSTQSSWSSEFDVSWVVNTWNDALLTAYHYETGDTFTIFPGLGRGRQRSQVPATLRPGTPGGSTSTGDRSSRRPASRGSSAVPRR